MPADEMIHGKVVLSAIGVAMVYVALVTLWGLGLGYNYRYMPYGLGSIVNEPAVSIGVFVIGIAILLRYVYITRPKRKLVVIQEL